MGLAIFEAKPFAGLNIRTVSWPNRTPWYTEFGNGPYIKPWRVVSKSPEGARPDQGGGYGPHLATDFLLKIGCASIHEVSDIR